MISVRRKGRRDRWVTLLGRTSQRFFFLDSRVCLFDAWWKEDVIKNLSENEMETKRRVRQAEDQF